MRPLDPNRRGAVCRAITALILALGAIGVSARPLPAQLSYSNTTFLNGFASDSTIWDTRYADLPNTSPPGYLWNTVVLHAVGNPNVKDSLVFDQQVARIVPQIPSGTRHVLVGHSLGSLIARGLYIDYPALQPRIAGIVAVTAPHQGAPLADNVVTVRRFLVDVQRRVNDAVNAAKVVPSVFIFMTTSPFFGLKVGPIAGIVAFIVPQIFIHNSNITLDSLYKLETVPALRDLKPASTTVQRLNAGVADGAIPHANIYGWISPRNAALRIGQSLQDKDAEFKDVVSKRNWAVAMFKACKVMGYATIVMSKRARQCAYGVKVLGRIDDRWALYVNGTDAYGRVKQIGNDGVVPNERSRYPVTTSLAYDMRVDHINHMNVYKTRKGLDAVADGMIRIGMIRSGSAPPPPPPSGVAVSISGPSTVNLCGGTWFANASNGVAPFSYSWKIGTATYNTGTTNSLDYAPSSYGSFTITATATDSQGKSGSGSMTVTVSTGGMC